MKEKITIGVLIGNANSPHTLDLMQGIHQAARKENINVIFFLGVHSSYYYVSYYGSDMDDDYDYQFYTVYDYSSLTHADALIITYGSLGMYLEENDKYAFLNRFRNVPKVFLEETDETGQASSIISDNYHSMYQIVEHLILEHGCRNLTFLAGPPGNTDAAQRKQAFLDALRAHGLDCSESRIAYGDFSECVELQVDQLLDSWPDMDAMVCANDIMAGTAYKECELRGLRVGTDLAVTGYDDISSAVSMEPPLTTILQNAFYMGQEALQCAIRQIQTGVPEKIVVPAKPQIRCSCGCKRFVPKPVSSRQLLEIGQNSARFRQETWFLPLIAKDMLTHLGSAKEFYASTLSKLWALGLRSSWLLLLDAPVKHRPSDNWVCPERLHLACCHIGNEVVSYEPADMPVITGREGLEAFLPEDRQYCMSVLSLFSGEMQYGILITEIDPSNLALTYLISTQLGNTLMSRHMFLEQQKTHRQLEKLVEEINEKNRILNYMSEYDTMTNCLNRNGFVKKLKELLSVHAGKTALFIMADMDHLKQINDAYGHAEGDSAILFCSDQVKAILGDSGIAGRFGGDEFVALLLPRGENDETAIRLQIEDACRSYNASSGKPYLIEISLGFHRFVCRDDLSMPDIMKPADLEMYQDKKKRKESVLR